MKNKNDKLNSDKEGKDSKIDVTTPEQSSEDIKKKTPIKESHHVLIVLNDIGLSTSCAFSGASYIVVESKPATTEVKE